MFIPGGSAIPTTDYTLTNSLRFRASASAFLSRTPASTGSRQRTTYSFWIKRGTLGTLQRFIAASDNATGDFIISWTAGNALDIYDYTAPTTNISLTTTQLFRDPSAWYHIVIAFDTTQATAADRVKVYVNGSQVTAFSSATYPTLNANLYNNQASIPARIGIWPSGSQYLDGYMDEINFIDGQALTPSSFGSTNATTGVWQPARYTGTYGTNGYYLNFTNIALTSGSNTGLGQDFSGNGNFWNTNNISVTAGATYDAMSDVPTLTSATAGNYCTWNPVAGSINTLSNGNLTYSGSTGGDYQRVGTLPVSSGKWYFETTITTFTGPNADMYVGFSEWSNILYNSKSVGNQNAQQYSIYTYASGTFLSKVNNASFTNTNTTKAGAGDVLMLALDLDNGKVWFGKNGTWVDSGNPATGANAQFSSITGTYVPGVTLSGAGVLVTVDSNFGQRPFAYTPPTGFNSWNTFNLPNSTIVKGNTVMDATLYTGNGSTQTITNAGGFRPDLVWLKARSQAYNNGLFDSNRGTTRELVSNSTGAETNGVSGLTAFNSNGFTIGTNPGFNESATTFVGWQWQAGQGTNTTNTAGSITSTVSVNTTAGFSIVTFNAGSSGNKTVGHGLGVAPKMVILKDRANAVGWFVYLPFVMAVTQYMTLNTTLAITSTTNVWGASAPTSSVFGFTSGACITPNANGVAYCFAEIAGFSKFGSYTGNGSTDGTFVYLGFRPKYLMIKVSSTTEDWYVWDSSRGTYNANTPILYPDLSAAESTAANDFLSNGFKPRTAQTLQNASGQTYIYAAFAENPFKNALAR